MVMAGGLLMIHQFKSQNAGYGPFIETESLAEWLFVCAEEYLDIIEEERRRDLVNFYFCTTRRGVEKRLILPWSTYPSGLCFAS